MDWFRTQIAGRYSVKLRGRLGPRRGSDNRIRILNRIIQRDDNAIVYEADQRHAELIIKHLGLSDKTNSVATPGVKRTHEDDGEDEEELSGHGATKYRALAARAIFVAQDRKADIGYAVKELSRRMIRPNFKYMNDTKKC